MARPLEVAGIDAYRRGRESGWVAIQLRGKRFGGAVSERSLSLLLERLGEAGVIGIDMPIGLPTKQARRCDLDAREFVGLRRSSVFLAPPRRIYQQPDYQRASALCRELTGKGLSQQAWGLRDKVMELAPLAKRDSRLIEVHPEVSFREMAGEELAYPKSTWSGQQLRINLLATAGIELPPILERACGVPASDVIDAAGAAWSARRVAITKGQALPAQGATGDGKVIWR